MEMGKTGEDTIKEVQGLSLKDKEIMDMLEDDVIMEDNPENLNNVDDNKPHEPSSENVVAEVIVDDSHLLSEDTNPGSNLEPGDSMVDNNDNCTSEMTTLELGDDENSMDSATSTPSQDSAFVFKPPASINSVAKKSTAQRHIPNNASRNKFARDKALFDEMKFMADFDPAKSTRNRDKKRKRYTDGRPQLIADQYEDCDCLVPQCPGCHYPCKRCGDTRCGHECRQGRRWLYESIEIEGRGIELKNPHTNNS